MVRHRFLKYIFIFILIFVSIGCEYLFDMKPPEITIISPTDGQTAPNNLVVLEAEVKEDHLKVTELYINGNKRSEYTENNILDSLTLSEGSNQTIKLKAFDKAGNWDEKEVGGIVIPNSLPNIPSAPSGPTSGYTNNTYSFSASTTDPDGDSISYRFEWGDGTLSAWSSYVPSGNSVSMDYSYSSVGTYSIKTKAKDEDEAESDWSSEHEIIISSLNNSPPNNPSEPSGPAGGYVYSTYSFSTSATDPDENNVSYQFDWGDSSLSAWSSYVPSGTSVSRDHSYTSTGTYSIKSKAKDEEGAESGWSNGHSITISGSTPGTEIWSFETGDMIVSSPAIGDDGTIYVGSRDYYVYAINPDGTEKWTFRAGNGVTCSPAIGSDGTIYIGAHNNKFYAINPDGTEKWTFSTSGLIGAGSPAIGPDGIIYIGNYDGNFYAINPDGTEKWTFPTDREIYSSPAISSDNTIYIPSCDSNLYAINPDGTEKWTFFPIEGIYGSSPAIGSDGTIYIGSGDSNLYAINPDDGTEKWTFPTAGGANSSPAIGADGTIYVGCTGSIVHAINPDGTEKWTFPTEDIVYSSPAIGMDGTIYVGCNDRIIYAINPDGTEKWTFPTGETVFSSPAIGDNGTIYVGSLDGNLYAIYGTSGGLANSPWPMFLHDLKHSGRVGGP